MGEKFDDQLRRYVLTSGLSQRGLCRRTGLDPGHVCRWLQGREGLSLRTVTAICEALDLVLVPRSELAGGKPKAQRRAKKAREQ